MFQYFNPHPQGTTTKTWDCVKRAIVATTGMDYRSVQRGLNAYKKVTGAKTFYSGHNPHHYVEDVLNAKKIFLSPHTTVADFCQSHPRGRYILDMDGHWSSCINGVLYDTWDCRAEQMNFAYAIVTEGDQFPDLRAQVFRSCCTSEVISEKETLIRIYDGNGNFVERTIPTELTAGYVRCLQDSHYPYFPLQGGHQCK